MRTPTPAQRTAILKNYAELRRKLEAMERLTIEMMRHPDVTAEQLKEAQIMYSRSYQGAFDCYRSISGLGWQFGLEKPGMQGCGGTDNSSGTYVPEKGVGGV